MNDDEKKPAYAKILAIADLACDAAPWLSGRSIEGVLHRGLLSG